MLRNGLVSVAQEDKQLASFLNNDPRPTLQNFAAGLIRECLSSDPPVASHTHFAATLGALTSLVSTNKANDEFVTVHISFGCFSHFIRALRLLDDLRGLHQPPTQAASDSTITRQPSTKPDNAQLREKLFMWFQQWVSIYQRSHTPEKSFVPFINALTKQGILKIEDVSSFFFRVCAESSVNSYNKYTAAGEFGHAFQALDAMSRLIVYIIKYHGDASGVNNDQAKVHYMTKILTIVVLVLANMHEEQGANFQQKPFFRFFSSLLNDLHAIESNLGPVYFDLLLAIGYARSSIHRIIITHASLQ